VVWYNHLKLKDIKQRVATQQQQQPQHIHSGGGDERSGAPRADVIVTHRSKAEILADMRRLQAEMALLEKQEAAGGGGGVGAELKIRVAAGTPALGGGGGGDKEV
jgi:hypothetical protein